MRALRRLAIPVGRRTSHSVIEVDANSDLWMTVSAYAAHWLSFNDEGDTTSPLNLRGLACSTVRDAQ